MKAAITTKREFKKEFGREPQQTSFQYIANGRFVEVFKKARAKNAKDNCTVWGYEKADGVLTKKVVRSRISYMKAQIKKGKWDGRALEFAVHHLHALERKLAEI